MILKRGKSEFQCGWTRFFGIWRTFELKKLNRPPRTFLRLGKFGPFTYREDSLSEMPHKQKKPSTRRTRGCHLTGKAHDPPQTRESRKRGLSVALARLLLFLGLEGSSFTHSELIP